MRRAGAPRIWLAAAAALVASAAGKARAEGAGPERVTVAIDDEKVVSVTPELYHGTNFVALWNNTGASAPTLKAFSQTGMQLVRFPGGVPCQWWDWKEPKASGWTQWSDGTAWNLAKSSGGQLLLQTNSANDKEDRNKQTGETFRFSSSGQHQAGWVAQARERGYEVAFWEIGNEPEMDAPEEHKKAGQDAIFKWYNAKYEEQVRAIRKVDPKARVMGPASTNTWFWWAQHNLRKFLVAHGDRQGTGLADALSVHWYPEGGKGRWEERRGTAQSWQESWNYLSGVIRELDSRPLPLYITEWNWGGGMDNDSAKFLSTALGNADCVGMFLRTGVKGHAHFCMQKVDRNWGFLPMKGESRPEASPTPTYYALAMAARLRGEVLDAKSGADEKNVLAAYATRRGRGSVQVMLINKTERPLAAALEFAKYRPAGKDAEVYSLRGASGTNVYDREVVYNGVASPKPQEADLPPPERTRFPESGEVALEPYSMKVVVFEPSRMAGGAKASTAATAKEPAAKPPPGPKGPSAAAVESFDRRLLVRIGEEVGAGRKPRFHYGLAQGRAQVTAVERGGTVRAAVLATGMEIRIDWAKLTIADRRSLALAVLREGEPGDHCLAAFYLLAAGDRERASGHLVKGGAGAAEVRAAFGE